MKTIEYSRVIEMMSDLFQGEHLEYLDFNGKTNNFSVSITTAQGDEKRINIQLNKYSLALTFDRQYLEKKEMESAMKDLEYKLEQYYINDIRVNWEHDDQRYTIVIED